MKLLKPTMLALLVTLFFTCNSETVSTEDSTIEFTDEISQSLTRIDVNINSSLTGKKSGSVQSWMTDVNEALEEFDLQLEKIELLGMEGVGNTVFFKNTGNKQLSSDFVPNDPRNIGGTDVPYWTDGTELGTSSGMTAGDTYNAIVNTMNTWDGVTCSSGLGLPELGVIGIDVGLVQFLLGFGGFDGFIEGTILHGGILPAGFFDALQPGGGNGILGVTFTFVWTGTDIDGNGKGDVAIKEIYINDNFNWQDAPNDVLFNGIVDFETVVLHEVGHGLSQGHFGKAFANNSGIHFSPAALMNAGYSVGRRDISGTDKGGHCSNWGEWPNN